MPRSATRLSPRLFDLTVREAVSDVPAADVWRTVAAAAERAGLPRPSYERIRTIVVAERRLRRGPSTAEVLVDVWTRARPPQAVLDHLDGTGVPRRRR